MPLVTPRNLKVQWNEDYKAEWSFKDDNGQPIDLTGITLALQVRAARGAGGPPLLTATITKLSSPGFVQVSIADTAIKAVSGGQYVWRGAYDLRATDVDGRHQVWAFGAFIIDPGVTQ